MVVSVSPQVSAPAPGRFSNAIPGCMIQIQLLTHVLRWSKLQLLTRDLAIPPQILLLFSLPVGFWMIYRDHPLISALSTSPVPFSQRIPHFIFECCGTAQRGCTLPAIPRISAISTSHLLENGPISSFGA